MKKKILGIIGLIFFSSLAVYGATKDYFGAFAEGISLKYDHQEPLSIIKLEENKILILGHSRPNYTENILKHYKFSNSSNFKNKFLKNYQNTPSEIYHTQTDTFSEISLNSFYYEPEGMALDKNRILLTMVCNTDKENQEAVNDCYKNMQMAIYNTETNKYSFIENKIKRKNMFMDVIAEDKILIIGGFPVSGFGYSSIPANLINSDKSIKFKDQILEYDLKNNSIKEINLIPQNFRLSSENIIKMHNNIYVFLYENSIYKLDLNKNKLNKLITINSSNKVSSLSQISKEKFAFINENKVHIYNICSEKVEKEIKLLLKRQHPIITPVKDNFLLITGGEEYCFPSNLCLAAGTEFIDLDRNEIKKGPNIGGHFVKGINTHENIIFFGVHSFRNSKMTVIFKVYE